MTLLPGDIITTGTPPGVGMGPEAAGLPRGGEVMRLGIEGLGSRPRRSGRARMSAEARLRESLCGLAASLFQRGLTHGLDREYLGPLRGWRAAGIADGTSFGRLDLARLAVRCRPARSGAIRRPRKCRCTGPSTTRAARGGGASAFLPFGRAVDAAGDDPRTGCRRITPYAIMQLGKVTLPLFPARRRGHGRCGAA